MNKRVQLYGISLLSAVLVTYAGHYYATHDPASKKDLYAAYLLGLMTACFVYFALRKKFFALPDGRDFTIDEPSPTNSSQFDEEETEADRLFENSTKDYPEPPLYDHEFYNDRLKKATDIAIYLLLLTTGLYFAWIGRYIVAGLAILPFLFVIRSSFEQFNDRLPQVKIAGKGIWIKDFGFKPWEVIQKINILKDKSGKSEVPVLEIFLRGSDADLPDSRTTIDEIKNWKDIGMIILSIGSVDINNEY